MGFFSDLKQDLNQAVSELLPEEEEKRQEEPAQGQTEERDALKQLEELEAMLQSIDELQNAQGENAQDEDADEDAGSAEPVESIQEAVEEDQATLTISIEEPEEEKVQPKAEASDLEKELRAAFGAPKGAETVENDSTREAIRSGADVIDKGWVLDLKSMESMDETAVITSGMRVKGDILSNGSADVFGEVYGNVQVKGKLNVTGRIDGNSKAAEILADSAKIHGDVISDGAVRIGAGTVIVGSVEATDAMIAGAVKGTIDVKGPVVLDSTAIVLGDIRARSIQINNGARIEGMCVLCYAEQSAAKFFEEQEA